MKTGSALRSFASYPLIILYALLMSLTFEIFIFPNSFAPAGINGLTTMIQYLFHFSVGYMSLIINIPLLIAAFFIVDKTYSLKTFVYILSFSFGLIILQNIDLSTFVYQSSNGANSVLAVIASGTINGLIYGSVLKMNSSTGGNDIIAALIRKKKPHLNLMWIIFGLNSAVAILSYFVYGFQMEPVILTILYCFISSKISDAILKGGKAALKFEIITSHAEEISQHIIKELKHSVTVIHGTGMYSHENKDLLICIVNKHQVIECEKIINRYPNSFAYISSVHYAIGNFKNVK